MKHLGTNVSPSFQHGIVLETKIHLDGLTLEKLRRCAELLNSNDAELYPESPTEGEEWKETP
jgi:hypothetical protein